jgi:hypothetical protein
MDVRRSVRALVAGASALAVTAGGVAARPVGASVQSTSASSAGATTLTLKAPAEVSSGNSASLRGALRTKAGRPVPRVPVVVQARQPGGTWTSTARTRTSRRGTWKVATSSLTRTTEFRARSKRTTRWSSATSVVRRVVVAGSTIPEPTATPTPTPTSAPTVVPTPTAVPGPQVLTSSLTSAQENEPYSQPLSAAGGQAPLTWSLAAGSLPAGLALSSGGTVSGTPTVEGGTTFTARVRDAAGQEDAEQLTIQVDDAPLEIVTAALPGATQGNAYSTTLQARGAEGATTWSLLPGSALAEGLALSSNGTVSGTPVATGTTTTAVQVVDGTGRATTGEVSLTVAGSASPVFLDNRLPAGQVGAGYQYPVRVVGGTGSYTWSVVAGSLPPGLTLDTATGRVGGTPSGAASGSVTLRAQDGTGAVTRALPYVVTASTSWLQVGRDEGGTLSSPGEQTITPANASQVHEEWRIPSGDLSRVADGVLYSTEGVGGSSIIGITARDLASGEVLWSRPLPVRGTLSDYCQTLAVSAALVVCQTSFDVVAVSRTGGHDVAWQASVTDPGGFYTGLVLAGGRALTINHGRLVAHALADGQVAWSRSLPNPVQGVSADSTRVYTSDSGGELRTFALATGTPGWVQDDAVDPYTPPVVVPGRNEVLTTGGGPLVWRSADTGQARQTYVSLEGLRGRLAVDGQRVYVPTGRYDEFDTLYDVGVTAVRHSDATEVWRWDTAEPVDAGMAVAGDVLWVHTSGSVSERTPSTLTGLTTAGGAPLTTLSIPDTSSTGPMAAGGRVVVTSAVTQVLGVMAKPPRVPVQVLPTGWTGRSYAGSLGVVGGSAPYAWTLVDGTLPAGLTLSAGGQLTGTSGAAGVASFRVRVTDRFGLVAERQVRLAVRTDSPTEWRTMGGGNGRTGVAGTEGGIDADSIGGFSVRFSTAPVPATAGGQNGANGDEPLIVQDRVYGVVGPGAMRVWSRTAGTNAAPLAVQALPDGEGFTGTAALSGDTTGGTLFALTDRGRLVAMHPASLAVLWSVSDVGQLSNQQAPLVVGDKVVVAAAGEVVGIDVDTQDVAWRRPLETEVDGHAVSSDGTRAFAYAGCDVVAVVVADGSVAWRSTLQSNGSPCARPETWWPQQRVSPVVRDGVVYASTMTDGTAAFDATTGAALWRTQLFAFSPTPIVSENWVVITGAYLRPVVVLDRDTGEVVSAATTDVVADMDSSATLVGDLLVFRTNGRMTAIDLVTMQHVWTSQPLGTAFTSGAVSIHSGRLYAYTDDGRVVGLGAVG